MPIVNLKIHYEMNINWNVKSTGGHGFNGEKWVETGYYDLVESVGAETLEDLRLSIKEATED